MRDFIAESVIRTKSSLARRHPHVDDAIKVLIPITTTNFLDSLERTKKTKIANAVSHLRKGDGTPDFVLGLQELNDVFNTLKQEGRVR